MTEEEKECEKAAGKGAKSKEKINPSAALKSLFDQPNVPDAVKNSVKDVDFDFEFDTVKVSKDIMKSIVPIMRSEIERWAQTVDPFDKLVSHQDKEDNSTDVLSFCLLSLNTLAFNLPDLYELIQLKFKNLLIKCVLCNNLPDALRNEASLICEKLIVMSNFMEDDVDLNGSEKWLSVYFWMVKRSLSEGATRSDIKRVWTMHKLLDRYVLSDSSPAFDTLKATIVSPNFLQYKEGRQHVAHLLAFNKTLVVPFHGKIKDALPSLINKSKTLACSYGEVFNMAWIKALPETKEVLEEEMFQRWMEIYLKLDRPQKLTPGVMGKTVFRILSFLHNSRRLLQLSSAITRLYEPILWRSLKSHHPLERCNAADLFLDVFPLERPEANIVENSNFMEKQLVQILELLMDESHFTRIVTIKGLISVFKKSDCLSNMRCREILSLLANELANDSVYMVRVAVWEVFTSLVSSDEPLQFLSTLLPQMTNHFHDTSEHVRKTFTTMLIRIGENTNLNLDVSAVAPRPHMIARLALEGEAVGKLLTKLLMKYVYFEGIDMFGFIKNLQRLIWQSSQAAKNLFKWSAGVITVENAHFIIMAIAVYLRQYTKDKVINRPDGSGKPTCVKGQEESDAAQDLDREGSVCSDENQQNAANVVTSSPVSSPVKKKRKSQTPKPIPHDTNNSTVSAKEVKIDIDPPTAELHAHMLSCAHVVWLVFANQLQKEPSKVDELNQVLSICLQNYLRCYKGTPAWYAAVSLASLVPLSKLSESTTASSSCLAELRRTSIHSPIQETGVLIYSLTAWNRGFEIIELAIDYIDPAFKLFQLNSSAFLTVREGKGRKRVVRFFKDTGKEMIGLRLLAILLEDLHNQTRLLQRYDQVQDLFFYLEGIKVIIEAKFAEGLSEQSAAVLTDEFIKECLSILVDLIPVLNRTEVTCDSPTPPFIATQQMSNVIDWAIKTLVPHLKALDIAPDVLDDESERSESDEETDRNKSKKKKDPPLTNRKKSKKRKKKKKEANKKTVNEDLASTDIEKSKKKEPNKKTVNEDLAVSCCKIILKQTTFMINTKMTDVDHIEASVNFARSLIKSEGKFWFVGDCLDLVIAICEYTRAYCPDDNHKFLSNTCPSLYSDVLQILTTSTYLTKEILSQYSCDLASVRRKLWMFPQALLSEYEEPSHETFVEVFCKIIHSCISGIKSEALKLDTFEVVSKVENLPLGMCMITQAILGQHKLLPSLLTGILKIAQENAQDGVVVACCISYLLTILESQGSKFKRIEMVSTVQSLYEIVQNLPLPQVPSFPESPRSVSEQDSFFLDPLAKLDSRAAGLSLLEKIAESTSCQLVRPLTSIAPPAKQSFYLLSPKSI